MELEKGWGGRRRVHKDGETICFFPTVRKMLTEKQMLNIADDILQLMQKVNAKGAQVRKIEHQLAILLFVEESEG